MTHAGGWHFDLCCGDDPVPVYLLHNEVLLRVEHGWFTLQMYLAVHLDDYGSQALGGADRSLDALPPPAQTAHGGVAYNGRIPLPPPPTSYMQHNHDFGSNTELSTTAYSQSSVSSVTVGNDRRRVYTRGPNRTPASTKEILEQLELEHQMDIADHRTRLQEQTLQQLRASYDVLKQKLSVRDAKISSLENQVSGMNSFCLLSAKGYTHRCLPALVVKVWWWW